MKSTVQLNRVSNGKLANINSFKDLKKPAESQKILGSDITLF